MYVFTYSPETTFHSADELVQFDPLSSARSASHVCVVDLISRGVGDHVEGQGKSSHSSGFTHLLPCINLQYHYQLDTGLMNDIGD